MQVQVIYRLAPLWAIIDDHSVAILFRVFVGEALCKLAMRSEKLLEGLS
jgi:hypothetical protein